jgi:hypothetical protein
MPPPELGLELEAINDTGLLGVVRGHLELHAVTDHEADETLAHLAGDVREHFVAGGELDLEHGACEHSADGAIEFDRFFFLCCIAMTTPTRFWLRLWTAPLLRTWTGRSIVRATTIGRRTARRGHEAGLII